MERKRRPLVAVMGNSVVPAGDTRLALAESLGAPLVEAGYRVLCGGREGIMEAVCRGAKESLRPLKARPSRYFLRGEPKMRTHLLTLLWPPELVFP